MGARFLEPRHDNAHDVFVHDREKKKSRRVNLKTSGAQVSGGQSYGPSISANGRFVAFDSAAPDLVGNDTNGKTDSFRRGALR